MADIYNNITAATVISDSISSASPFPNPAFGLANSFSTGTGPTGLSLVSVGVLLTGASKTTGGIINVSLLASVAGSVITNDNPLTVVAGPNPGPVIVQLGVIYDSSLTPAFTPFYFPVAQQLAASTHYWIAISDGSQPGFGNSNAYWGAETYDPTNAATVGEFFSNGAVIGSVPAYGAFANGWTASTIYNGPYQMQITTV
jgi:hypothetical protein